MVSFNLCVDVKLYKIGFYMVSNEGEYNTNQICLFKIYI